MDHPSDLDTVGIFITMVMLGSMVGKWVISPNYTWGYLGFFSPIDPIAFDPNFRNFRPGTSK